MHYYVSGRSRKGGLLYSVKMRTNAVSVGYVLLFNQNDVLSVLALESLRWL